MSKDNTHSPASELADAIHNHDIQASIRLLEDSGGACQARNLADAASKFANANWTGDTLTYGVTVDRVTGKETLTMLQITGHTALPVVGITQGACEK
jgi:hypothetical protein